MSKENPTPEEMAEFKRRRENPTPEEIARSKATRMKALKQVATVMAVVVVLSLVFL
jgi:hypothetical protein